MLGETLCECVWCFHVHIDVVVITMVVALNTHLFFLNVFVEEWAEVENERKKKSIENKKMTKTKTKTKSDNTT